MTIPTDLAISSSMASFVPKHWLNWPTLVIIFYEVRKVYPFGICTLRSQRGRGGGGGGNLPRFWVGMCPAEPKSRPITRANFFIKSHKNGMNLLIFLDLTYNPCKNFKFYSLQGQNVQIFLIFTCNQGKFFLILPITRGVYVYLVSIGSCQ